MAFRLFEHNARVYKAALAEMERYGKAAIIHPTGTGKSYIAFKLIADHPDTVVLWISPSEYIFKTQIEGLKKNDPDFPLVDLTESILMKMVMRCFRSLFHRSVKSS